MKLFLFALLLLSTEYTSPSCVIDKYGRKIMIKPKVKNYICLNTVAGHEWLQNGYDITSLDIYHCPQIEGQKQRVFNFTDCDEDRRMYFKEGHTIFSIPEAINMSSNLGGATVHHANIDSLSKLRHVLADEMHALNHEFNKGMFSMSADFLKYQRLFTKAALNYSRHTEHYYTLILNMALINNYLTADFIDDVKRLPTKFDLNQLPFIDFIETYGTHFIRIAVFGGITRRMFTFHNWKLEQREQQRERDVSSRDTPLSNQSNSDFPNFEFNDEIETCTNDEQKLASFAKFDVNQSVEQQFFGGQTEVIKDEGYRKWMSTLGKNVYPTTIYLGSISSLIDNEKADEVERAVKAYVKRAYLEEITRALHICVENGFPANDDIAIIFEKVDYIRREKIYDSLILNRVINEVERQKCELSAMPEESRENDDNGGCESVMRMKVLNLSLTCIILNICYYVLFN